jgi:hypothetical protein
MRTVCYILISVFSFVFLGGCFPWGGRDGNGPSHDERRPKDDNGFHKDDQSSYHGEKKDQGR